MEWPVIRTLTCRQAIGAVMGVGGAWDVHQGLGPRDGTVKLEDQSFTSSSSW